MRKLRLIFVCLSLFGCLAGIGSAATFQLNDGRTVTGEVLITSANEAGIQLRLENDQYERIPWNSFSQEDLKKFAEDRKLWALVVPFIEVSRAERLARNQIKVNEVPRLERPAPRSLLGAMFSSSVGVLVLLLLYAANLYAAFEVSIFRARPPALVCGVSAVLPLFGPILFLSMPTRMQSEEEEEPIAPAGPATIQPFATPNPAAPARTARTATTAEVPEGAPDSGHSSLRLAHAETPAAAPVPEAQVFQRGAFTFNRRFFETKFPGFFGVVRREAEKDLVLEIRAARGQYVAQRISRISANELHVQIHKGNASEEIMIPFSEIQEIKLKHESA